MKKHICNRDRKKSQMKDGFSLVEVIIAIALLAILTMPILAYFTNAAVSTSRGKSSQKAAMAAETVMEEVNAFDSLEQIEEYILSSGTTEWSITPAESKTGEPGKTSATILEREGIEVDGKEYKARITLEYDYPAVPASGVSPNQTPMPELKEVYSDSNAVIAEGDQLDRAVSHYLMLDPAAKKDEIREELSQGDNWKLKLSITEDKGVYTVQGSYLYTYKGNLDEEKEYEAVVLRTKVQDLANVYFFYNRIKYTDSSGAEVVQNREQKVEVEAATVSTEDTDKNEFKKNMQAMHIYFVCQKETEGAGSEIDSSHTLKFSMNDNAKLATYHTNIAAGNGLAAAFDHGKYEQGTVISKPKGRIAKVTVDVYDPADTSMAESLTHLESSKGE